MNDHRVQLAVGTGDPGLFDPIRRHRHRGLVDVLSGRRPRLNPPHGETDIQSQQHPDRPSPRLIFRVWRWHMAPPEQHTSRSVTIARILFPFGRVDGSASVHSFHEPRRPTPARNQRENPGWVITLSPNLHERRRGAARRGSRPTLVARSQGFGYRQWSRARTRPMRRNGKSKTSKRKAQASLPPTGRSLTGTE